MNWRPILAACVIGSCLWLACIFAAAVAISAPVEQFPDGTLSLGRVEAIRLVERTVCGQEDSPEWSWPQCGNRERGVVTMWGTQKVVNCGDFHWLATHDDLDRRSTSVLRGDWRCGR
jgi:hypothetical protein